jgi:hypothetical protein
LRAEVESVDVVLGQGLAVPVEAVRAAGADGEIKLTGVSAPPGITVQEGKIPAGQTKGAVTLAAAANAALRAGDVVINASLKSGGGDLTAPAPVIRARVVEPFSVALGGAAGGGGGVLKAARGGKIALEGKVARASPFAGQVDLKVEGLPAGVAAAAANVAPDKTDFSLEISVDAAVAVGEVELKLVASAPLGDPKQPVVHAVPPVVFRLAIGEEAAK